ncbi:Hypothetical protein A7982_04743 [Minicystis rosea]|nr:Hypothetical protein A7982_04743 [Minicystis rosea]
MGRNQAGVRRRAPRGEDDPLDSFFDVPAAVLCATCGQADCPGCTAASEQESGVLAIVPWERSGGTWSRLWATATATTRGAEAFFAVLPDGEIPPAMRFAVLAELLAVASMAAILLPLLAFALPGLTLAVVSDPTLRWHAARWIGLGVPIIALWMVAAHVTHGAALDAGARRLGARAQRRRAVRFGLYACGWDLMAGPLGAAVTLVSQGLRATIELLELAIRAPSRSSRALLQGVYQIAPADMPRARRAGTVAALVIAIASGVLVSIALALALA